MHILAVDPPTVSRFSGDSFVSGSSWHSVLTSAVPIVGSSFIDCSRLSGSFDTWTFDSYFAYPLGSSPLLGIGDTIAVYRQAFDLSVSLGAHSSAPAFMGRLTHIVGWGPTLVEFGVDIDCHSFSVCGVGSALGPGVPAAKWAQQFNLLLGLVLFWRILVLVAQLTGCIAWWSQKRRASV
ncbi:hypothetical protein EV424DRAFT_1536224 [Suillus variegatus]|nr:hypothetical protein EV424DRAFT_1536224 [Suillus variegatus]